MASGAPTHPDLRIEQTCINLKQWMREVDGSKLVSELTIPGSHDSATGESTVINTTHLLKTQSLTISEQLEQGVRFLDIRAKLFCNDYILVHGKLDLKLSFSKLISDCRKFLQENPSEFILFSLKKEGEDHESDLSFEQCFCEIIKTEMSLWFLGNYIPTLDEVRGKCVLVRRFPLSRTNLDTLGIGIVFGEDTVFEYKFNEDPLQYVYCEDKYVIRGGNYHDVVTQKMKYIKMNLDKVISEKRNKNILFITFLSCIHSINTPFNLSMKIHAAFMSEYEQASDRLMGKFPCDYIERGTVQFFVNNNFMIFRQ